MASSHTHTNTYRGGKGVLPSTTVPYQYLHSCSKTHVHKITNLPIFQMKLGIHDFDGGKSIFWPKWHTLARCHFWTQTSLDFHSTPLPMALDMDLPTSKSLFTLMLPVCEDMSKNRYCIYILYCPLITCLVIGN
jgi:hypothetical protein